MSEIAGDDGVTSIAMELLRGQTLRDRLAEEEGDVYVASLIVR